MNVRQTMTTFATAVALAASGALMADGHTPQTWAGATGTSALWSGYNWDAGVLFVDGNDAVFATDGAIAEVDANFSAYTLTFNNNAALTGTGTLTVPTITVADGKAASIAGPLAGDIVKTGAGTLTLGSSREGTTTTLAEGTLVANAPVGTLVLGTDATKPVTFDYGGQTYTTPLEYINDGLDVTLTNGTYIIKRVKKGSLTVSADTTATRSGDLVVGDSGTGTLTINGGTVDVNPSYEKWIYVSNDSGDIGTINLNGGQLKQWHVRKGNGSGSLVFNGGTLVANGASGSGLIHSNLLVTVNAGGGAIDNGGYSVTVKAAISGAGGMKFCGVGTTTLNSANTYTGGTMIAVRTKLVVTSEELARMLANGGITVVKPEGVSAKGTYKLLSKSDGDCTVAEYESITKGAGLENATFAIDGDGDITVTIGHTPQTWAGAAETSALWSGNNWDAGVAFDDGNDAVFATDGAIAEVDANYSAYTLTFSDNATLTGTGTLSVPTITVAGGKAASIAGPLGGPMEKVGPGTLILGSSREGTTTTLTEGTLVANAPVGTLVLGTDATKPVTFDYGGQTYATAIDYITGGRDVTLTNGTFTIRKVVEGALTVSAETTATRSGDLYVGESGTGTLTINGGAVSCSGKIYIPYEGDGTSVVVVNDGNLTMSDDLVLGRYGTGTLTINGGTVDVSPSTEKWIKVGYKSGYTGTINLNGGQLKQWHVRQDAGSGSLVFNGGTLVANGASSYGFIDSSLPVTVNAGGGAIDNGGYSITVYATISGTGGMTYKGGGSVTFTVQPTYTGVTTVEVGTTLVVPAAIAGDKLAFTIPDGLADGVYSVVSISGDSQFANNVLSGKPEGFVLSSDKKAIRYIAGNPQNTWIGGSSGSLSDSANWLLGVVPVNGNCVIGTATAANLTVGNTFAASSITFSADSAAITISGENAISGITAITNLSASTHVINVPVVFAGEIFVVQGAMSWDLKDYPSIRFAGGVTGTTFAEGTAKYLDGAFTLTTGEDWVADAYENNTRWGIPEGSSLTTPSTTNTYRLALGDDSASGGAFTAGVVRTSKRLVSWNNGEYVVTNELEMTLPGYDVSISQGNSYGAFKFEKIMLGDNGGGSWFYFSNNDIWIGEGGLNFADGTPAGTAYSCGANEGDEVYLRPWHSDYTIATKANSTRDLVIHEIVHFGTDDENGVPRTVTCNGLISNIYAGEASSVFVEGAGTFVVNNPNNTHTGPWTVKDTATLMVSSGSKTGTGIVSVEAGATLATTGTGTATVGTNLTFAADACIGFNFTTRSAASVFDLTDTDVVFGSNLVVKVSAADGIRPFAGAHVLTSGSKFAGATVSLAENAPAWALGVSVVEGDIVLEVKPMGTQIIVR